MFGKKELEAVKNDGMTEHSRLAAHHYQISRNAAQRGFDEIATKHAKIARSHDLKDMEEKRRSS